MIIHYFYLKCIPILPFETDPPLVIDADTVLARAFASKHLKAIGRWDTQVLQRDGAIQHAQLAEGDLLNIVRQLP
jgi:hypothetical protein